MLLKYYNVLYKFSWLGIIVAAVLYFTVYKEFTTLILQCVVGIVMVCYSIPFLFMFDKLAATMKNTPRFPWGWTDSSKVIKNKNLIIIFYLILMIVGTSILYKVYASFID